MLNHIMRRFARWFSSPAGVAQTFAVTMLLVVIEHVWRDLDPNGFLLLYALTVYSGVTQPILAYASSVSASESEAAQEEIGAMQSQLAQVQESQTQLLRNHASLMETMLAMVEKTHVIVTDVAADVDDLVEEISAPGDIVLRLERDDAQRARADATHQKR